MPGESLRDLSLRQNFKQQLTVSELTKATFSRLSLPDKVNQIHCTYVQSTCTHLISRIQPRKLNRKFELGNFVSE